MLCRGLSSSSRQTNQWKGYLSSEGDFYFCLHTVLCSLFLLHIQFAGHMFVKDPRGSDLAKDAIDKLLVSKTNNNVSIGGDNVLFLQAAAAVKKANTGEDMQPVTLSVSIRSIICTERDGKVHEEYVYS